MDTSETFIKQCEKAEEIQGAWKHSKRNSGDWYHHRRMGRAYVVSELDQEDIDCLWLPRQDQLQEIYRQYDKTVSIWGMVSRLKDFIYGVDDNDFTREAELFTSMEQLWLAFVMKEKYQKTWDGNDWIKNPLS